MLKKTLLSAAVASSFALSGCLDDSPSTTENAGSVTNPPVANGVFPIFSPSEGKLPIPNDLIFQSTDADGTFEVPDSSPPVTTALNELSGASTVAPIDIALSGAIDAASLIGPETPPNPNQNVWLVALDYNSKDPVQGLSNQEIPTVAAVQPEYVIEHLSLDGASTIRISPKSPLDPQTRYVVAITNGVTDASGDAIIASPGAAGYEALTDATNPLSGSLAALQPVQALINSLWEPTSLGYINTVRGALSQPALTDSDLTLTYSFTTSGDEKVLGYINDPASWVSDSLQSQVRVAAAAAASAADGATYATVGATVQAAYDSWLPSSLNAALAGCDAASAGLDRFNCAGKNLVIALEAGSLGFTVDFPDPSASTITMVGAPLDVTTLNPDLAAVIPANTVMAQQGSITIPYYSALPVGYPTAPTSGGAAAGTGLPLKYGSWVADDEIATALGNLGLTIPQADATKTTAVNYLYPFPKKQGDVTIPVFAIFPNPNSPMDPTAPGIGPQTVKPVFWGHGLGGNRTQSLGFGSLLVAQGVNTYATSMGADTSQLNAIIAIDQPLHGLAPIDADGNLSPLDASVFGATERHFGYQDNGATPANPPSLIEAGGSGSMFINIESFLTFRDSNRQNVLDLLTLRQSVDTNTVGGHTLGSDFYYTGHSLGTISSPAFVATANTNTTDTDATAAADDIKGAAFFTPAGGVTRVFENAPAFAPSVVNALAGNGVTPDTSSYQAYLNVFQAASDTFDAVNFADVLANAPGLDKVLWVEAVNDIVLPIKVDEVARTLRAPAGTTIGSETIVVDLAGSPSQVAGAEALGRESGATYMETAQAYTDKVVAVRYKTCEADHGTPSVPGSDAFTENLSQVISMVASDAAAVVLTNASLVETTDPLPLVDLAPSCP